MCQNPIVTIYQKDGKDVFVRMGGFRSYKSSTNNTKRIMRLLRAGVAEIIGTISEAKIVPPRKDS